MTFEELKTKHADTLMGKVFTVNLPNKMWAWIERQGENVSNIELKYGDADARFAASIGLGVKSNESIDKLLDCLKGE